LAIDSPTVVTYAHVAGYVVAAALATAALRVALGRIDVETLG
jgi:hypothetical protein